MSIERRTRTDGRTDNLDRWSESGRFGFSAETARPFLSPYSGPFFMALALKPGFTPPQLGRADYATAFETVGDAR